MSTILEALKELNRLDEADNGWREITSFDQNVWFC